MGNHAFSFEEMSTTASTLRPITNATFYLMSIASKPRQKSHSASPQSAVICALEKLLAELEPIGHGTDHSALSNFAFFFGEPLTAPLTGARPLFSALRI